ncbi:MAG: glycine cleavage system aminomethyltransferase GcvT [Chloroflexi bacterium]|nr:glycine cleavage system aminomethyltransferase GcvT [Chloroflexota bacterium]
MTERRTPLYEIHLRTASKMVKGGGDYMFPLSYTSHVEEHSNTRTNVGMQDLSTMGEVDVKGPGAERLLNRLLVNEIRDMHPGQVRYSTMCNEDGGIVDDVTVYKFGDEHFMVVTSSGPREKTAQWITEHATGMSAYATDLSGAVALISVQGPRSRDFLLSITKETDLENQRFFRFSQGVVNKTKVLISRSGYTGELGYELYIPAEQAAVMWEYLQKSGKEFGLMPYGVAAMQSLRIEKALPLYGPDMDERRNPFEIGLNRWIRFDKREFVGREALLQIQDMGLNERWTGLVLDSKVPAATGDRIFSVADIATLKEKMFTGSEAGDEFDLESAGELVGEVTSSAVGYSVEKTLALGYVRVTHTYPGARLLVEVNGRPTLAKVVNTPFFDPTGIRTRARGPRKVENQQ